MLPLMTAGCPRHDLITLTGGAIGQGLPNAIGAAIACPDRPVLALIGDGTAMYTIQSLWTHGARAPRRDRDHLQQRLLFGAQRRARARRRRAHRPQGALATRSQRPAASTSHVSPRAWACTPSRADSAEDFCTALDYALAHPGPHLIEALIPESLSGTKRRILPWLLRALPSLPPPLARALKRKLAP